jgi:excisionase family DNA binding protein
MTDIPNVTSHLPRLMDVEGVVAYLGLDKRAVYRLVEARQMPYVRIGRRVMFLEKDLESWLGRCRVEPQSLRPPCP